MTKTLKQILEGYAPNSTGEKNFIDKHVVLKHEDRNGNKDAHFKGKTKYIKRKEEGHGHDAGEDHLVYEESEDLTEARGYKSAEIDAAGYKFKSHMPGSEPTTLYHHPELDKHIEIVHEKTGISGAKKRHVFYSGKYGSHSGGMQTRHMNLDDAIRKNNGELKEEVLDEGVVGYKHYRITAGPKNSSKELGAPEHVIAHPTKMKTLGVHTEKGGGYGHTSHVTVTNTNTGEQSHHNVYQREWGHGDDKPLVSIRHLSKEHPGHHNALKHYLSGKTKLVEESEDLGEGYTAAQIRVAKAAKEARALALANSKKKANATPGGYNSYFKDNAVKEEAEDLDEATVNSKKYSWGTMKTVQHGSNFSIPLHPEHHEPISKLEDGKSHSFKDETGAKWLASRNGADVHFSSGQNKTKVPLKSLQEEAEDLGEAKFGVKEEVKGRRTPGAIPSRMYHKPSYVANPSEMPGDHHTTPEQRKAAKYRRLLKKDS